MFGGRATGTPYLRVGQSEAFREVRMGYRLELLRWEGLEMGIEGTQRESTVDNMALDHEVMLDLALSAPRELAACVHVPIPDGVFVTIDEDPVRRFGTYRRDHQPTCPLGQAPYMGPNGKPNGSSNGRKAPYIGQGLSVPNRLLQLLQY